MSTVNSKENLNQIFQKAIDEDGEKSVTQQCIYEASAYYDYHVVPLKRNYAKLRFKTGLHIVTTLEEATNVALIFSRAQSERLEHTTLYSKDTDHTPSIHPMTGWEHRIHWIATFYNVSLTDVREKLSPRFQAEVLHKHHIEFSHVPTDYEEDVPVF